MGIETAFRAMENSLTEVIGKWIDAQAESEMLESIDIFIGPNLSAHMAQAAMLLMRAAKETQEQAKD